MISQKGPSSKEKTKSRFVTWKQSEERAKVAVVEYSDHISVSLFGDGDLIPWFCWEVSLLNQDTVLMCYSAG